MVGRDGPFHVRMAGAAALLGLLLATRVCRVVFFELEGLQVVVFVIIVQGIASTGRLRGGLLVIRLDRHTVKVRND
ncbi:hypothetical protein D3C71_1894630 [compost metagenome]